MRFPWKVVRFLVLALALLSAVGGGPGHASIVVLQSAALQRSRASGDRGGQAEALSSLGSLHMDWGEPAAAFAAYREAVPLFVALGRRREAADALRSLGIVEVQLGHTEEALHSYRQALEIHRSLGLREGQAWDLGNMARAYSILWKMEEALDLYQRQVALWRELGRPGDEGSSWINLGRIYYSMGEVQPAIDYFNRGLPLLQSAGRQAEAAGALDDLGKALARSGQTQEGIATLERSLDQQRKLRNEIGEAVALSDLGSVYERLDRKKARAFYTDAIRILRKAGDRVRETPSLARLGRLQEEAGDLRAATESYSRVLDLSKASGSPSTEATALLGIARIRRRQGDLVGARQAAESALSLVETMRMGTARPGLRVSFLAGKQDYYELDIDLLMDLGRAEQAFEVSERARARVLLDTLAQARAAQPRRLREIQEQLDPETLLLEYALGKERSFLWAVTSTSLTSYELLPRATLEEEARQALLLLGSSQRALARTGTRAALAELSQQLLGPVAGQLRKRLLIVGDGALQTLPFGALPVPGRGGDPPPLVSEHELVSLPSASTLVALRGEPRGRSAAPSVAVLADPAFGGRFSPLPYSRQEAEAILRLVPPDRRLGALGAAANRRTVLSGGLARYQIVHFATHGILDPHDPELSGVALSDGILRVQDIYRLRLPADLVVLSACDTALGQEVRGEGLIGLTRAFFSAGARRVLVSLWPVDDSATAELMRRFYRGMLQDGLPPAAALAAAQNSLRQEPEWEAPYYWAGFILEGDQ